MRVWTAKWCIMVNQKTSSRVRTAKWCITQNPKLSKGVHTEKWCITQNPKISSRVQTAKWCITQNPKIRGRVHTAKWCTVAILKTSYKQATKLCTTEYPEKSCPALDNKMLYHAKPKKEVQGFGEQKSVL